MEICFLFLPYDSFLNKVLSDNISNAVSFPYRSNLKPYLQNFWVLSLQFKLIKPVLCMYTAVLKY